jgi:hypothetical protein
LGEGIAFCERRGITEVVLQMRASRPVVLAELGLTGPALAEAGPLADQLQASGDVAFFEPRALQLRLLAERGTPRNAPTADEIVTAARDTGLPGFIAAAFAAAVRLLLAQGHAEQARALLAELDQIPGIRAEAEYQLALPELLRTTLTLGDTALAKRLLDGVEPRTPWAEHALASARAQLAEAANRHTDAAQLYDEAAQGWRQFGSVPERAYALLGQGRCLAALGKREAEAPLCEARDLFTTLGYQAALAETQALLGESEAAAV